MTEEEDVPVRPASSMPKPAEIVFGLLIAFAVFSLFDLRGNSSHIDVAGRSLLSWIAHQWIPSNQDFGHGWFMMVGALLFSDWRLNVHFPGKRNWYARTLLFGIPAVVLFLLEGARGEPGAYAFALPIARALLPILRPGLWILFFSLFLHQSWLYAQTDTSPKQGKSLGLICLALSLMLHWAMYQAQQPRISLVALTGTLWSVAFALHGWKTAKFMLLPASYMLVCFLAWFLMGLTMPLRLIASTVAVEILRGFGIQVIRQGTLIRSATPGLFMLNVADACSGLRSLSAMTAMAAPYAFFTIKSLPKRWILFFGSIPLAMLANAFRVVLLAICASWLPESWFSAAHDYSGFLVFILSLFLLFAAGSALNVHYREKFKQWKKNITSPTRSA